MVNQVTKRLRLNLRDVKNNSKTKQEIGNFILKKIDKFLNKATSPVNGKGFKKLNDKYKKKKQADGGKGRPDLFLEGDMRSQITFTPFKGGIDIGVFDTEEAQKADNHNKNSAKSKNTNVPKRQFIPYNKKGQTAANSLDSRSDKTFNKEINDGIREILKRNANKS